MAATRQRGVYRWYDSKCGLGEVVVNPWHNACKAMVMSRRICIAGAARRAKRASLSLIVCGLSALGLSCGAAPEGAGGGSAGAGGTNLGGSPATSSDPAQYPQPVGRERCKAPLEGSLSLGTIEDAVQRLNALPKPTSVACFVESLPRPLSVFATSSVSSAQPALSPKSPRVFIKLDRLWVSVVMDGDSSYLIEFGYVLEGPEPRSIKGEVVLPIHEALAPSAPYDRLQYNGGTGCGLCHYNERPVESISFAKAFSSVAFRPRSETHVAIDALRAQAQQCDPQLEPHRCEMLSAVFGGGEVVELAFPDSMVTFF